MKDKACDICGMPGHLKSTCRQASSIGGARPTSKASALICLCCGKAGHQKVDCSMKDKQCDLCGVQGHLRATCRMAEKGAGKGKGKGKGVPGSIGVYVSANLSGVRRTIRK